MLTIRFKIKRIRFMFKLFILAMAVLFTITAFAYEPPPGDIVFLVDTSEVMNYLDPNRVTFDAIARFIEAVGVDESRISVITFLRQVEQTSLRRLENEYVFTGLCGAISTFQYSGEESNIAPALPAVANLISVEENPQSSVFFLVLGEDISGDFFAEAALHTLTNMQVPIHTIEVNAYSNASELFGRLASILTFQSMNINTPEPIPETTPEPTPQPTPAPEVTAEEEEPEEVSEPLEELESERLGAYEVFESADEFAPYEEADKLETIEESELPEEKFQYPEETDEVEEAYETEGTKCSDPRNRQPHTLLYFLAIFSGAAAAFSVFRLVKAVV